jgi:multicomponent Na+:H+ antiporter subunit B
MSTADSPEDQSSDRDPDLDDEAVEPVPYVESPIIMATVRIVAPFVFTFGLFIMFHGADSPGGGFQGGVIVGTVILMLGIAFGIDPTREWVDPRTLVGMIGFGVLVFLAFGFGTVALGGGFLHYEVIPVYHAVKYSIEAVELAIGVIVAGIVSALFFAIDAGTVGGDSS